MKRIIYIVFVSVIIGGLVGCTSSSKAKNVILTRETTFELPGSGDESVSVPCSVSLTLTSDNKYISKMVTEEQYDLTAASEETIAEITETQDGIIRDVYKNIKGFTYDSKYEDGIMQTSLTVNMEEVDLNNEDSKDYLEMLFKFAPDKYEDGKYPLDDCISSHLESEYKKSEG